LITELLLFWEISTHLVPLFDKNEKILSFSPAGMCHTFSETLGAGLKSLGCAIWNFGLGPKILGPEWAGT